MKVELYSINKSAKVGTECTCPSCNTKFVKSSYQQIFCKSKSGTICKDKYWNTVDPNKRCNTTRISPASKRWLESQADKREREYNPHDDIHPFSGEAFGDD